MERIWILSLTPSFKYGRWVIAFVIFLSTYSFQRVYVSEDYQTHSTQLFFSFLFAYIIPVFSYIIERSGIYFESLRSSASLSDSEFQLLKDSLSRRSTTWVVTAIGGGLFLAVAQMTLILGSPLNVLASLVGSVSSAATTLTTCLLWVIMTTILTFLTNNARTFATLGRDHIDVSILTRRSLLPFGDMSVISTLALIGALAFFPLMMIEGASWQQMLPGILATGIPMLMLFFTPLWSLHNRLVSTKADELNKITSRINAEVISGASPADDAELLERIVPLLSYQRELGQMSTWPIDMGSMSRLILYLIIPPLTWVGAALIENLFDGFM
ncbi:MAG: hypothetical protein ACI9CE_001128 [Flavobacterium sp.]|jgi:hypothetical protein